MGILARNPHEEDEEREDGFAGEPIEPEGEDGASTGLDDEAVLRAIDHVAIVVVDLDEALTDYGDTYGAYLDHRGEIPGEGADVAFVGVGGSSIALISPTHDDSAYADFLAEGGPGLHHIAYRVEDIEATLAALAEAGRALIDTEPVPGPRGSRVAFVHPDGAHGVLVQIVER